MGAAMTARNDGEDRRPPVPHPAWLARYDPGDGPAELAFDATRARLVATLPDDVRARLLALAAPTPDAPVEEDG